MKHLLRLMVVLLASLMLTAVLSVSAQDDPASSDDAQSGIVQGGILVESTSETTLTAASFNPMYCTEELDVCRHLMEKVYPSLFAVDPETGLLLAGETGNFGVVVEPTLTPDETWTLRRDLVWSDGTPVTAYDVFFTWAARVWFLYMDSPIRAMQVVDEYTLSVEYRSAACSALPRANFLILPSHVYSQDFHEYVDAQQALKLRPLSEWFEFNNHEFAQYFSNLQNRTDIPPTAGAFEIAEVRPNEEIRLISDDLAYILRASETSAVDAFLSGDIDLLINPPINRRADLLAATAANGLQIAEPLSTSSDFILFNVANPGRPRSAHYDSGAPIDQGAHRVFSNVDVRRAFQLAIDMDEIIRVAFQGDAVPLASTLPATSWAYNPDLEPSGFDPREAEALLEAAGWKAIYWNGTRVCLGCETAEDGTLLSITLTYQTGKGREIVAELIGRHLRRVGFDVRVGSGDFPADQQHFDAYLMEIEADPDPDQWLRFSAQGDVIDSGPNITSYHDEALSELLNEARTLPGCNPAARAELYREAQALLQEQQPYAFLYTRTDFIAAQPSVVGFAPIAGRPFWNTAEWRVIR